MATMVLVEDESFERTSLKDCIDWNLIGVQIVGEAANGSQGLAKVMELQPDIVLADVKMPVMDGIEMSRRIRSFLYAMAFNLNKLHAKIIADNCGFTFHLLDSA